MTKPCTSDLIIIGAGPAGLSAAINAASEGLSVRVLDQAVQLGGQARESNAIENYLGFPESVTGERLMNLAVRQARKFGNIVFDCPALAVDMRRDEETNTIHVMLDDYREVIGRTVLLSNGLTYRRHTADNIGALMGQGIYYGMPMSAIPTNKKCIIAIVGGANSAGQAAIKLAENGNAKIKMFIRKKLDTQMSHYLITRIRNTDNIEVCEGCEITAVTGNEWLSDITYKVSDDTFVTEKAHYMFIFIGAAPRTLWLRKNITLDKDNFIVTGSGLHTDNVGRRRLYFETSMSGVFAAGDVRSQSTKRIAAAIGEGSAVVSMIHQYLALS